MREKYVIVEGFAGLGNRLRTIAAAIEYAEKTGRTLCVNWTDGMFAEEGEEAFHKYFDIKGFPVVSSDEIEAESFYPDSFNRSMLNEYIVHFYKKKESRNFFIRKTVNAALRILRAFGLDALGFAVANRVRYFESTDGKGDRIVLGGTLKRNISADAVIFVDNVPPYKKSILLRHIYLKQDIMKKVNSFVTENGIKHGCLGLHIRATDKNFLGTLNRLIAKIDDMLDKGKIKKVFLSTDNRHIEDTFRNHYKEKLVVYPKLMPEDEKPLHLWSQEENDSRIKDQLTLEAIMDMFILSKTEYLLNQWGSTFSGISRLYHKEKNKEKTWQAFQYFGF